ncbi:testis-expressed protein 264 homolog isoform X2 [Oratosquilla oratoria]|uniref:testis-expressed protein 264 homolog isoform X2 n=1 Tax=Oratosquilla oratoria TaxID=337810 RepID=UPI003F768A33
MDMDTALVYGLIALLAVVLVTIGLLLIQAGLFTPVVVRTCKPEIGEVKIAYKYNKGPYSGSGQLFTEVHTLLPEYRTIGVYYDDPKKKDSSQLRYIVGIIIAEDGRSPSEAHIKVLEENGYKFITFPAIEHAVQTRFPFRSTVSIIMAIMKVYPALREYVEHRSLCVHPFLEIYDNDKKEIIFVGPLARQGDFYVPEVQDADEEDQDDDDDDDTRTENSSRSWDESASIIRGAEDSENSESQAEDSSASLSQGAEIPPLEPAPETNGATGGTEGTPQTVASEQATGEDSDANTGSSFEEIDEKEAALMQNEEEIYCKKEEEEAER